MPFSTVNLPLNLGFRRDLTDLASSSVPPALHQCTNASFNLDGEVSGRYGAVSLDGTTLHSLAPGLPSQAVASLATESDLRVGLSAFGDDPVVQCEGRMFRNREGVWVDTGPFWSMKAEYGELLGDPNDLNTLGTAVDVWPHAGSTIVAFPSTNPIANYADVDRGWPVANGVAIVGAKTDSRCVAGDALFITDGANLRMLKGFPLETRTLIATDCLVSGATTAPQRLWAVQATASTGYYVVYQTNAGSVKLLRLSTAGAVLQTLTLTAGILASGSAFLSLGLAANTTKVLLAATGTNDTILTKVITIASWTDAGIDSTHTEGVADTFRRVGCAVTPLGNAYVTACLPALGHIRVLIRTVAGAGFILSRRIHGQGTWSATTPALRWSILFPPQVLASQRVVQGFYLVTPDALGNADSSIGGCTWLVLDITLDLRELSIVAAGEEQATAHQAGIGSACVTNGVLSFALLKSITLNEVGVLSTRAQRVALSSVPAGSTQANGLTLFTGQYPYFLDGYTSLEAGYPVAPIASVNLGGVAGSMTNGSRTVACCWSWTDANGNAHRSAPSVRKTIANPTGERLAVTCTLPQWASCRAASSFQLEVYISAANPSVDADLFVGPSTSVPFTTFGAFSQTVTIDLVGGALPLEPVALYSGDNILENERPFGNAGVATVGSRVWCAEEYTARASKLVTPGSAPAWSSDDSLHLQVPSGYGRIKALGGLDNLLVLICEEAVLVFSGQGPGDAGGPSDFDSPRRVYRAKGPVNPSDVCEASEAVVWTSSAGELFAIAPGGAVTNIGRPVQDAGLRKPTFVPGGADQNDKIVLVCPGVENCVEVLDMSVGQWSTWTFPNTPVDIGTSGSFLTILTNEDPYVLRVSNPTPVDVDILGTLVDVTLTLQTRSLALGHLGKVKSIKPLGKPTGVDVSMILSVQSDEGPYAVLGNSQTFSLPPVTSTDWPRSLLPELRLAVQRMESFRVSVVVTPAAIKLTGLQAEVQDSDAMPRQQRG